MCLQCDVDAVTLFDTILPGFSLMQAKKNTVEWPEGWYGLVEINDPTVVFPGPLLADPTAGMTDEQLNALPNLPAGYDEFTAAADTLAEHLILPAMAGYQLATACQARGYNPEKDGYIHYWLLHYLATTMHTPTGSAG